MKKKKKERKDVGMVYGKMYGKDVGEEMNALNTQW